jgi:large subunit ribosomal protein L6
MSRIGKKPITLESGVSAVVTGSTIVLKGPKGQLQYEIQPGIQVQVDGNVVTVKRESDHRQHRSLHGLTRALIQNLMIGVSKGYMRKLELQGVGYKAEVKKDVVALAVGYPEEKTVKIPVGVNVSIEKGTVITLSGINKEDLGQFAAALRRVRPPEPYKGKGIKYMEETIVRKVGKTTS